VAEFRHLRGSSLAAVVLGVGLAGFLLTLLDGGRLATARSADRRPARVLSESLGLTDPALFNEARYARHSSQADRHSAFQDHPMALEHFPAGTLVPPP
jgi:hypothetical protein